MSRHFFALMFTVGGFASITAQAQEVFWADTLGRSVYTAGFDGSNPHAILNNLPTEPSAIAVDPLGSKLYVAFDGTVNQVWRTNLDGSGMQVVFDVEDGPDAIALDPAGGKMYLAIEDSGTIQRANLDGTNVETLQTIANAQFTAMTIDPGRGVLYWLDRQNNQGNKVFRASTNGGPIDTLITEPGPGLTFGNLYGLAFDSVNDRVYLLDEDDTIFYQLNLNGDILERIRPSGAQHPRSVALVPEADQMFWPQTEGVFRSDLFGGSVTPIVSSDEDGIFPLSIAAVPEPSAVWLVFAGVLSVGFFVGRYGGLLGGGR
jgi:hypothetical protein